MLAMPHLVADEAYAVDVVDHVVVTTWRGVCTTARLTELVSVMEAVHARTGRRLLVLNVIAATTPVPGSVERELLKSQFDQMRGRIEAVVCVLEHQGALATLSRAVLTTVVTLAGRPFDLKMFVSTQHAMVWLTTSFSDCPQIPRLVDALARCNRAMEGRNG
jgi:hypothetical protein